MELVVKNCLAGRVQIISKNNKNFWIRSKTMKKEEFLNLLEKKVRSYEEVEYIGFDGANLEVRGVRFDRKKYLSGYLAYKSFFRLEGFGDTDEDRKFLRDVEAIVRKHEEAKEYTKENIDRKVADEIEYTNLERDAKKILSKYMQNYEFFDLKTRAKAIKIIKFLKDNKVVFLKSFAWKYKDFINRLFNCIVTPVLGFSFLGFSIMVFLSHIWALGPAIAIFFLNVFLGKTLDRHNEKMISELIDEIIIHYRHEFDISKEDVEKLSDEESMESLFKSFIKRDLRYLKDKDGQENLALAIKIHNLGTKYAKAVKQAENGGIEVDEVGFLSDFSRLQSEINKDKNKEKEGTRSKEQKEASEERIKDPYLRVVEAQIDELLASSSPGSEKYLVMLYDIALKYAHGKGSASASIIEDMDTIRGLIVSQQLDKSIDEKRHSGI